MRLAYVLLSYLLAPFVVGFLLWRGVHNRAYWERLGERFGFCEVRFAEPCIWVHAVSVGEVQAASPLVNALRERFPDTPFLMTTVTPTGAGRVADIFQGRVAHAYAPYDLPGSVRRFFARIRPKVAIVIETELWPNLYHECGRRNLPLVLASARISPRSLHKYRRFVGLFREALSHGIVIAAQSQQDAERFRALGASEERTHTTGNIKFDFQLPPDTGPRGRKFREQAGQHRPVWVAASTHDGEEPLVLEAFGRVRERIPDCLLLLVPRHPERFDLVCGLVQEHGYRLVRRTSGATCTPETDVFVVDTLGELPVFYAASDVAFVGGSLVPVGGHNLLEPATLAVPIVSGPHVFNAEDIADKLVACGAARIVASPQALAGEVVDLLSAPDQREAMGHAGQRMVEENRGALARLVRLIEPLIRTRPDAGPPPGGPGVSGGG